MKSFIENNIKFIIVIVICLIGSSITTLATNYIFSSNEVSYDNTESGLHADSVQGAIDEVFQHATDYSGINNRLTNAEATIGTGTLTTTSNTLIGGVNELNSKIVSKAAASGGTDLSMITTGEKYTWNNKSNSLIVDSFDCIPGTTSYGDFTKNVSKNGYTPIGIVGMQAIASFQPIEKLSYWYLSGTTFAYRTSAPSTTSGLKIYILFKKNS